MNTKKVFCIKYNNENISRSSDKSDIISIEEPLEIYIGDKLFYTTMRLPNDEKALSVGLLYTEKIINSIDDIHAIDYCRNKKNKITIDLLYEKKINTRNFIVNSSCGICGSDMIEIICKERNRKRIKNKLNIKDIFNMSEEMKESQNIFKIAGSTHCAALFNEKMEIISFAEDIGRHNALDKAIGKLVLYNKKNLAKYCFLSSRLSYEMVYKASSLDVEIIAGISSVTSMALDLAKKLNITLIGFLRENRLNIYCCSKRINII